MTTEERIVEAARRLVEADDVIGHVEAYAELRDALDIPDTAYLGNGATS